MLRRIRESLRLHLQAKLSYNEVGRALKISKSVVGKYVSLARVAGVDWTLAETLSDEELEARLYRPALPRSSHQLAPDFAHVHQEPPHGFRGDAGVDLPRGKAHRARPPVGAGNRRQRPLSFRHVISGSLTFVS
jgi:hypothetical protein